MAAKLDLALVVRTIDRATAPLKKIQRTIRNVGRQAGLDKVGRRVRDVGRRMRNVGQEAVAFGKRIGTLLAVAGIAAGGFALRSFGQLEQLQISFESMLGSAEEAREMIKRLTDFAAKTPFQLTDLGATTKQLLAFGVQGDDIIATLQLLGDVASGTGVPINELGQIYGKAMSKGKVQTEELNQLAERGVPILDALVELAAEYGNTISKADVYKAAEQGTITFKALEEALSLLTSEGNVFHDQMSKQSQSLFGIFSTLKDNVFNAFAAIGKELDQALGIKQGMRDLIAWIQEFQKGTNNFKVIGVWLRELRASFDSVVEGGRDLMKWLRETVPLVAEFIDKIGEWAKEFGWLKIAAIAVAGVLGKALIGAIIALFAPLARLGFSLVIVGARLLWMAGVAVVALVKAIVGLVITTFPSLVAAIASVSAALWANPIVLIIAGIIAAVAGAAYLIWRYWDDIMAAFKWAGTEIKAWWDGIAQWFEGQWTEFMSIFDVDQIVAQFRAGLAEITDILPDFIKRQIGIDVAGAPGAAAPIATPDLRLPSLLSGGPSDTRVGGEVRIRLEGARPGDRIDSVRSDNPNVPIDVEAGFMLGAG